MGMMQYLKDALSLDGTLGKKETERRTRFFICGVLALCGTLAGLLPSIHRQVPVSRAGTALSVISCLIAIGAVLCKVPLNTRIVVCALYSGAAGILLWDLDSRTLSDDRWAIMIVVIDMLLVMRVPTFYTSGLVGFVVLWLVVLSLEESFRFGLFDLPGLPPQEGEYGRKHYHNKARECGKMPCPQPFPSSKMLAGISVFIIDFIITRGFAREVLKEQASMERTINAVQEIASLLAGYDVEKVAELLEEHEHELPQGMTAALRALEKNLRSYKAYLPLTCLLGDETADEDNEDEDMSNADVPVSSCSTASTYLKMETLTEPKSVNAWKDPSEQFDQFEFDGVQAFNISKSPSLLPSPTFHIFVSSA